jgi:signal transduction histidine kinase
MISSCPPDVSLYELAVSSDQAPQPLQISPTTFKSLVGLVFDLLIDKGIAATIWLKLPRGEVWQTEIDRFCQSATAAYSIYSLQTYQDSAEHAKAIAANPATSPRNGFGDASHVNPGLSAGSAWEQDISSNGVLDEIGLIDDAEIAPSDGDGCTIQTLPLATDSQLKREYFLLVVAPEFHSLVLAHRPRSMRSLKLDEANAQESLGAAMKLSQLGDEGLERKHPLLGLCTFDQSTIERVLDGVNRAIRYGQTESALEVASDALVTWDALVEQGHVGHLNPLLLGDLLTKQVQRQEEIWRSGAVYRRQAESATAFQKENQELLHAVQLKDDFVKTMGQELRTPLTSMKTALSLLNSPNIKPQQRQKYMDMLSRECDRQRTLITSVLDLVQIESTAEQAPMEPLRLGDVVPGVVSTYQPLAQEKGVMLAYTVPEDLPPVSCLNPWLKQIVIHLLHNSVKFTPSGGQVWVRAKQQVNEDAIQIEFRDTGIGIAQAELPKIFDRFYRVRQTSDDPNGVGLGLSIVQQLLLRCGGSISVRSKPGEGSIFSVLLPVFRQNNSKTSDRVGSKV